MRRFLLLLPLVLASPLRAQTDEPRQSSFVRLNGPGRFVIDTDPTVPWGPFMLEGNDARPIAELIDKDSHIVTAVTLFANITGTPTAAGCRDAVLDDLVKSDPTAAKNIQRPPASTTADASYTSTKIPGAKSQFDRIGEKFSQRNLFRFFGDKATCAEVHVSLEDAKPQQEGSLQKALAVPTPDLVYTPVSEDYFDMGNIFSRSGTTPLPAALYYERSLTTLGDDPETLNTRRVLIDNASTAFTMAGDLKHSRELNEAAIAKDPGYPVYYYDLACADAEDHNPAAAQKHLQQAFDRRANTLEGETLPEPAKDDSLLKLKKNKAFWAFVQSLPKN